LSIFVDTALNGAATVLLVSGRLVTAAILARKLGPEPYGQFVLVQWVIDTLFLVCSFGMPGLMTRFLPVISATSTGVQPKHLAVIFSAASGICVLCAAGLTLVLQWLEGIKAGVALGLIFWCVANVASALMISFMQARFRYDAILSTQAVVAVVSSALAFFWVREASVADGALALAIASTLGLVVAFVHVLWKERPTRTVQKETEITRANIFTYGANVWITTLVAGLVWSRTEIAILRSSVGDEGIAIYSIAILMTGTIVQGVNLLLGAIAPHLTRIWAGGDWAGTIAVTSALTRLPLLLGAAGAAMLIGWGDILIDITFGEQYANSYLSMVIISAAALGVCSGCVNQILQLETDAQFSRNAQLLGLAILLLASAVLSPALGLAGGAIGRSISQVTLSALPFLLLVHRKGDPRITLLFLEYLACTVIIGLLGALAYVYGAPRTAASIAIVVFGSAFVLQAIQAVRQNTF
jgi:O-antigen/teichoic acid export membrane protein